MFPNNEEDITYLDVEEDSDEETGLKFEDQNWEQYLPQVYKPSCKKGAREEEGCKYLTYYLT